MNPLPHPYGGGELDLFAQAVNWKRYWSGLIRPFLKGDVLEVGAGQGNNVALWLHADCRSWTALEPDPVLLARFSALMQTLTPSSPRPPNLSLINGTLNDLPPEPAFDALLYIDVLEHIEDDAGELRRAAALLRPGGFLIVLAPAHPLLYSPFDQALGHFRRYTRGSLAAIIAPGMKLISNRSLDSAGLLASAANRFLTGQSMPSLRQILVWDRVLVRASTVMDRCLGWRVGKSVLAIWQKDLS